MPEISEINAQISNQTNQSNCDTIAKQENSYNGIFRMLADRFDVNLIVSRLRQTTFIGNIVNSFSSLLETSQPSVGQPNETCSGTKFDDEFYLPEPLIHYLYVTLEEIATGCVKNVVIHTTNYNRGEAPTIQRKVLQVPVTAGCSNGTRIYYLGQGDKLPDYEPSDIIVVICEIPHPKFQREGHDLIFRMYLTISQAISGSIFFVPTLFNRKITVDTHGEQIDSGTVMRLRQYGLPIAGQDKGFGDLFVMFIINQDIDKQSSV